MDSATADRFRELLVDNPHAKFKRKVWKSSGDLRAYLTKKKWIRFHIDPENSLRELRPNAYLITVEISRHVGKEEEGNSDSVSFEFLIEKTKKKDCRLKGMKYVDLRKI